MSSPNSGSSNLVVGNSKSPPTSQGFTTPVLHAVSRNSELLACARTALRVAREEEAQDTAAATTNGDIPSKSSCSRVHPSLTNVPLTALHLYQPPQPTTSSDDDAYYNSLSPPERAVYDAMHMMRALDHSTRDLKSLVRRRGHTNDPTEEIASVMKRFQVVVAELAETAASIQTMAVSYSSGGSMRTRTCWGMGRKSRHYRRHYELVAGDVQGMAKVRSEAFQELIRARSEVLKMQARRRRMLADTSGGADGTKSGEGVANGGSKGGGMSHRNGSSNRSAAGGGGSVAPRLAKSQLQSPLFTMTGGSAGVGGYGGAAAIAPSPYDAGAGMRRRPTANTNTTTNNTNTSNSTISNPYATGTTITNPYSNTSSTTSSSGYSQFAYSPYQHHHPQQQHHMQQPYAQSQTNKKDDTTTTTTSQTQVQIQQRRTHRETKAKLDSLRQAERAIADIGTMFSKMATLVQAQGEVLGNIEDDVEDGLREIEAGTQEILKLYDLTKGNRGLILKVFLVLIGFILFFRLY